VSAALGTASLRVDGGARWVVPVVLLGGLAVVVATRWAGTRAGFDPLAVGAAFGLALGALAVGGRSFEAGLRGRVEPSVSGEAHSATSAMAIGIAFGLALVAIVIIGATVAGAQLVPGLGRPAAAFAPWVAITILVAGAEEALLRGRLFDALRRAGGVLPAVVITTVAFALIHVPLYGWHVVPLDLAVGLAFAGLRLATGSIAAPATAHATADLATWWL